MPRQIGSNRIIVKNTMILYLRMFIILVLNLYISRVILDQLGTIDYGIYNVVGSIVLMFSYMNSALSLATTRFFSYEMCNGLERLKIVYNTSVLIQVVFSIIILIIAETLGLWLVNNKLVIPADRIVAANWVYQFSILTTIISIISVSYISAITSHEKMGVYAIVSIIEIFLKLIVALMIASSPIDKLIFYGCSLLIITIISFFIKYIYCKRSFEEIVIQRLFSKKLFKQMFSFVGWNFFGATAGMSVGQGLNFIINIYFGPAVNAARGIAFQIEGAVNNFVTSINTAVNPQIVKRYSTQDYNGMYTLVFFSSKISFILLLLISFPIIIDAEYILGLWLKQVPDNAVLFTRLILIYMLSLAPTYAINMSAQASGNIKYFQITEGCIILLNIPIAILLYSLGFEAYISFVSMIILSITAFIAKLIVLSHIINFPVLNYLKDVGSKIMIIALLCIGIYISVRFFVVLKFTHFLIKTVLYYIPLISIVWLICFKKNEKDLVISSIKKWFQKSIAK